MNIAKFTHSIAFRFTAVLLVFAILVSLIAAMAEISIERKKGIEAIQNRFELIRDSYLPSLAQALWNLDEDQMNVQMRGIDNLPDIAYAEIKAPEEVRSSGTLQTNNTLSRRFPILHEDPMTKQLSNLGELYVVASLDNLNQQLADRVGISLIAQSVAIFSLAGFVLLAFRAMITRHLQKMAKYTRQLGIDKLDKPLVLSRSRIESPDNELYQVVHALNDMRITLRGELEERKAHERQISELNETLEAKVEQRTNQLAESNNEMRATLEKLQQTQKQLVESEKMAALGGLVAGVAHEINTPVGNGVTAASHLQESIQNLQLTFSNNQMKRSELENFITSSSEAIQIITKNLSRASELIRSFKQVAADQSSDAKRLFNVKSYFEEVLLSLKPRIKKTKINVTLTCPEDLTIYNEPGAFSHILTNLINNSLIHAYDENSTGTISIDVQKIGEDLQITYKDDGKGISESNLKNIFNPFFTTKRGSGGTGLGLHILYNKVTQTLKGSVTCQSKEGEGATFLMTIPSSAKK